MANLRIMQIDELTTNERHLLMRAEKQGYDINGHRNYILKWAKNLESYGTKKRFVYTTTFETKKIDINDHGYDFVVARSDNNDMRRKLMAQQTKYDFLERDVSDYPAELAQPIDSCFLCENIAQGIDAERKPDLAEDNVIIDLGAIVAAPNRYPAEIGHSLLLTKDHDSLANRIAKVPMPAEKTDLYTPVPGKFRGNIVTADYLEAIMEACDSYGLGAMRNHTLDGMSLPFHEHFHAFLEESPRFSQAAKVAQSKLMTNFGSNVYLAINTPFDTILVTAEKGKPISDFAVPLLMNMEEAGEVFTLGYYKGALLISPRKTENFHDKRQQVGAGMPLHCVDVSPEETVRRIKEYMPLKGEFAWKKYA